MTNRFKKETWFTKIYMWHDTFFTYSNRLHLYIILLLEVKCKLYIYALLKYGPMAQFHVVQIACIHFLAKPTLKKWQSITINIIDTNYRSIYLPCSYKCQIKCTPNIFLIKNITFSQANSTLRIIYPQEQKKNVIL